MPSIPAGARARSAPKPELTFLSPNEALPRAHQRPPGKPSAATSTSATARPSFERVTTQPAPIASISSVDPIDRTLPSPTRPAVIVTPSVPPGIEPPPAASFVDQTLPAMRAPLAPPATSSHTPEPSPSIVVASAGMPYQGPPHAAPFIPTPSPPIVFTPTAMPYQGPPATNLAAVDPDEAETSTRRLPVVLGLVALLLLGVGVVGWFAMRSSDGPEPSGSPAASGSPQVSLAERPTAEPATAAEPTTTAATIEPIPTAVPELLPAAEPTMTDDEASLPEPAPPRRRSSRYRSRREPEPVDAVPEPEPEPAPPPKPRPPSASELLQQAESALTRGDGAEAYRLASRSNQTRPSTEAMVVMARAACRTGDTQKAKRALKDIPLLDRGAVRRDCRHNGERIGL